MYHNDKATGGRDISTRVVCRDGYIGIHGWRGVCNAKKEEKRQVEVQMIRPDKESV